MNNRLTIEEIAGLLAESTGKEKEIIEQFLKEFVFVVRDYIFADRIVMIKGIGVFKIIQVDKRESIDVNTQERIVIPVHYKLSYLPEKEMREQVNKPFSFFDTIEVGEDVNAPVVVDDSEVGVEKDDDAEDGIELEEENIVVETEQKNETDSELEMDLEKKTEEVIINKERKTDMNQMYSKETSSREVRHEINKMKRFIRICIVSIIVLIVALGVVIFFSFNKTTSPAVVANPPAPAIAEPSESISLPLEDDEPETPVEEEVQDILATVKVQKGDRLNLYALEYYGHKYFWVYIYQHNKSVLDDPDRIPVGVELQIPSAKLYDINADDPASIKKAGALQTQILSKYRKRYSPYQYKEQYPQYPPNYFY
ncbi:MAG: HU family DNA-binding protein [Tannerellaceae bacterium]|jgi:nucleoid DNA-binding protein|nr:HU family DNA-binding protein [Tannerellaceae bacterium]